jgi:threonine aldolase
VDQYSMRLVTHLDVTRAQVEQAAQVICDVLNG